MISLPSLVAGGLPEFVTGTILIFFFFTLLNLLPPVALLSPGQSPLSGIKALVLPVLTLLAVAVGAGVRQVRAGMVEVLQQDFILFARLNGISRRRVVLRVRAAERARAERSDHRAEPAVPGWRHHHRGEHL